MKTPVIRLFVALRIPAISFIVGWTSFFLCGCSTPHTWTEDRGANSSELVKISGDWEHNYRVYIVKTDGKPMLCNPLFGLTQSIYVKPGKHTLFIGYENGLLDGRHAFGTIQFTAEAGKSYAIHRKLEGYRIILSVEDTGTGSTIKNDIER